MDYKDILLFISFLLIIAGMFLFTYYIYTENVNTCISDPIKFGVNKIKEKYDVDRVYGEITIVKNHKERSWNFGDAPEFNLSY